MPVGSNSHSGRLTVRSLLLRATLNSDQLLEIFGRHSGSERERQTYSDALDQLLQELGRSPEMVLLSWKVATWLARLIGHRDPEGWLWRSDLTGLEIPELEQFRNLAQELLPLAERLKDHEQGYIEFCGDKHRFFRDIAERRVSLLTELIPVLEACVSPARRKPDQRSIWHSTARLFAEGIETSLQDLGLPRPTRDSPGVGWCWG